MPLKWSHCGVLAVTEQIKVLCCVRKSFHLMQKDVMMTKVNMTFFFSGKKSFTYLTIVDMQHVWGASVNDLIAVSFDIKSPLGPIFNKDRHLSVVRIARGFHISATYNWTTRWSLNLSSGYPGKRSKHGNKACHKLHCPKSSSRARRSVQSSSIGSSFSFQVKCLSCLTQLLLNSNV